MIETSQSACPPYATRVRRVARAIAAHLRGNAGAADPVLEMLEPRLLLSAELGPGLDLPADAPFGAADSAALDGSSFAALVDRPAALDLDALAGLGEAAGDSRRELAFVDTGIQDYEGLVADLRAVHGETLEIVLLDPSDDGVARMTQALAGERGVDAVHVFSHGDQSGLRLGGTWLSAGTLGSHTDSIAAWREAFAADGDLLLYGCDLAAGETGRALTDALAALTGADVAASVDRSGHAASAGDWTLEYAAGAIETRSLLGTAAGGGWQGVLALQAYDGFDYATGSLEGENGGIGFATGWSTGSGSSATVTGTGLTAPDIMAPGVGGAGEMGTFGLFTQSRDLAAPLGTNGTTAWASFLMKPDTLSGGISLQLGGGGGDTVAFGYSSNDFLISKNASAFGAPTIDNVVVADQTYLLVARLDFAAGDDTLTLYVDPTPGLASPDSAPANTIQRSDFDLGTFTEVGLIGGFFGNNSQFDEIRIGDSFADVAPSAHYLDRFDTIHSFTGDDGTLSWTNDWQEVGESDTASTGDIRVEDGFTGGGNELWVDDEKAVWREADLSGANSATLSFEYARVDFGAGDHLVVYAQSGGGSGSTVILDAPGTWEEIARLSGPADDAAYASIAVDLSDYLASDARILFVTEGVTGPTQNAFVDDVRIDLLATDPPGPQPGGVVAGPTLWLKADAGITTGAGGVSQWDNQVANASLPDVRQGTAAERPDLVTNGLNFNPVVAFDGTDDELRDAAVLGSDLLAAGAGSIFTVVRIDSAEPILQWEENTDNRVNLEGPAPRFDYGDDVAPFRLEGSGMSSGYHIVNAQAVPGASVNLQIFVDGALDVQGGTGTASPLDTTANGQFVLGAWAGGGLNADMDLAEVIVYDSDLSAADRARVESYLAVKYGITLAQAAPTNYVDSGGAVIWDATANAAYANDIAGIGRDDASGLDQGQSRSISTDAILTISGAVAAGDGEFVVWGNDDGALAETATGNPAGVDQRLERVWRVAETGDLGAVTLAFDVGALGVTGTAASDFHLVMDSDTDFGSGASLVAASGFAGGIATFTGVDLQDGGFLALGTDTNLAPVADAGVTPAIAEGGTLMLDGSASSDPDGAIVSWEWDVLGNGSFEKSGETASYTWALLVAAGIDDDGTHDVTLRVTDNEARQHSITFSVTVTASNPPVFVADGPFTLDEHSAFGTIVGDVDANDGDGADPDAGDLIITEIMFDPASTEPDWEWIEIYNGGSETVDLSGFVLDDENANAHVAANIAGGSIAAGGTAVLYNADAVTAGDFTAAWGAGLNLVAVTGWSELPLDNGGDRIGLWSSFADYAGDHQVHANALVSLAYDDLGPWPAPDDAGSIFLTDLAADPADGANWALSTLGAPSPHGGTAAQSTAAGGNAGNDVGTPGDATPAGGVTYTITTNVNGDVDGNLAFAIGATTGVITVNDPDDLDFESGTPLVITVRADDGFAQTTTNVTIHLNDVNDLPSGSGALTTTALDDNATDVKIFTGLSVADPDAGESDLVLRITLSDPAAGSIAGGGLNALGGGVYERTGLTVAQANQILQVAQFTPTDDTGDTGAFTTDISVAVDDQGGGGFQSVLAPTTMTITRVNDGPTATNLSQTQAYVESGPTVDFDDIVVSDPDSGETVTATLRLVDTAAGALSVSGGATYTAGTGVWTITDSIANVNAALANVGFVPAPGYNADTTVLINIADGGEDGAAAATGSISLDGSSINDQLVATNTSQAKAYTEGAASVALDDIVVTDPDAGEIVTATLTLADPGAGSLTVSGSASYAAGTGVWTITDTAANVNAALANVAFAPGTDYDLDTSIAVHVVDGGEDGTVPVTGTITLDVTPVNDQLGATNTNQVQGYTEDAPSVALDDIVVTDVDTGETVSAMLTLADPGAGSLSVSGAATYAPGTGVWVITDTLANVNAALANVAFVPAAHYDAATSIAVSLADGGEDGTVAVTGTIALNATPVGDTPQAANASTLKDVQSAPIALDRHAADGPEVTHLRVSAITNGTLTLADGVSAVLDGQFVTVADGQVGLRFTPLPGSTLTGSFAVEASEDGVSVAAQSGQAIATVTVIDPGTPAPTPTPPPATTPEPPDDAEEEAALASDFASAETLDDIAGAPVTDASPPPKPAGRAPGDAAADEDAPPAGLAPQIDGNPLRADEQPADVVTVLGALPGGEDAALPVIAPDNDRDAARPAPYAAQVLAAAAGSPTIAADLAYLESYLGDNDGPHLLEALAADPAFLEELDLARQDLDDVAALNLVFAGSTVAVSTGLSVGYVVWLARGGVLLASMLSSMPAWRLVDPLPILASLASEDDRGDGESLASLLEDADESAADSDRRGDADAE